MPVQTNSSVHEVTACRVCGKADWQEVIDLGSMPLAGRFPEPAESYDDEPSYPLGVVSCRSCRLMSLTHVVDPEVLYSIYPYTTSDSDTISRHMRHVVDVSVERFAIPAGSLVVEIGSNVGTQLVAYREAGMRVLGIDPARNISAVANERGVPTLIEFFSVPTAAAVRQEHGPARLVLGRHVFAHIDNSAEVVAAARELLDPDGLFAIEVPYAMDMLDQNEFDTIYHEHLSYFAISPLVTLFRQHGMQVVDVERASVHGGSVLVFAGLDDGPWPVRPIVGELLRAEERGGLFDDGTYHRFAAGSARLRNDLTDLVRRIAADGKVIAGYGAPAKGNTLLNACGLGRAELAFCCDTTEFKQGKVLPGTHVPVRAPGYAREHVPDYYLMLAWNYADEILRKERAFLERGGRFIVPNPKPAIVSADSLPRS
jgi:SAM-dependent methyltransferase